MVGRPILKFERKIMKFRSTYAVTIPISVARHHKLKGGDTVFVYLLDDASLLIKFKEGSQ